MAACSPRSTSRPTPPASPNMAAWAADAPGRAAGIRCTRSIARPPRRPPDLSGNLSWAIARTCSAELAALDDQRRAASQEQWPPTARTGRRARAGSRTASTPDRACATARCSIPLLEPEADVRLFVHRQARRARRLRQGPSRQQSRTRGPRRAPPGAGRRARLPPVSRFLIAFDGSATTRRCVEMVCASPLLHGLDCHLLMVGDATREPDGLEWAREQLSDAGFARRRACRRRHGRCRDRAPCRRSTRST